MYKSPHLFSVQDGNRSSSLWAVEQFKLGFMEYNECENITLKKIIIYTKSKESRILQLGFTCFKYSTCVYGNSNCAPYLIGFSEFGLQLLSNHVNASAGRCSVEK